MFVVEPFVAKLLLPNLGGGPNVWNSCVLFFQITLLLGYLYAHLLTSRVPSSYQLIVHLLVIWSPLIIFPIRAPGMVPHGEHPFIWIFSMLIGMIGLVFFAISTTAPLLQKWYSQTNSIAAADPYFLYASSNTGGIAGLLAYPFLIEPNFHLTQQSQLLQFVYFAFAVLTTVCGVLVHRSKTAIENPISVQDNTESEQFSLYQKLRLLVLTAIPSALVLALTTFVTTDLCSLPLFWIIPLFIYLVSFIIAFSRMSPMVLK